MLEKTSKKYVNNGGITMAQQMVNGSRHDGSVTYTNRMSARYAVVSDPCKGKHKKPQDVRSKIKRKAHWRERNEELW